MLRLGGFSGISPTKEIRKALAIRLQGLQGSRLQGTMLFLECAFFSDALRTLQLNLFRPTEELLDLTPMALVIQSFRAALENEDKENLDKPLLQSLLKFRKIFNGRNEIIYFSNRKSLPAISITLEAFKKIENLEDSIPAPNKVIICGMLDEMKYSKSRLVLLTEDGPVNAFTSKTQALEGISEYFGKELTVTGLAHYKPGGRLSYIEVHEFFESGKERKSFSYKPHAMSVQEQISFQLKSGKPKNPLSDITGKWPGEESLKEILTMLD
jgi:hypothetical protein